MFGYSICPASNNIRIDVVEAVRENCCGTTYLTRQMTVDQLAFTQIIENSID